MDMLTKAATDAEFRARHVDASEAADELRGLLTARKEELRKAG